MSNLKPGEIEVLEQSAKDIIIILGRYKKRVNAINSSKKAKANGSRIGRKKIRNDKNIWKLRDRGLSIRAIAKVEGVSSTAVQRSLHERGGDGMSNE